MILEKFVSRGGYEVNVYVLADSKTRKAAVIDPGGRSEEVVKYAKGNNLEIEYIILTHAHGDHIAELKKLKELTGAKLVAHKNEKEILNDSKKNLSNRMPWGKVEDNADVYVEDKETLMLGDLKLKFLHTPGHTPGCMCIKTGNIMFTGDTLFAGSIGRCDLFGGDFNVMKKTLNKLKNQEDNLTIYPGHGPHSTMGREKLTNPYFD